MVCGVRAFMAASEGAATPITGISSRSIDASRRSISPVTRARAQLQAAELEAGQAAAEIEQGRRTPAPYSARRDGKVASCAKAASTPHSASQSQRRLVELAAA